MLFSFNWLKDYAPGLPKPEKLADILNRRSFEVVSTKIAGKGDQKDFIFDIEVLPNRLPDAASHAGMAREAAVSAGIKFKGLPEKTIFKPKNSAVKSKSGLKINILEKEAVARYQGAVIGGIKVKPSPKWMRDRLTNLGLKPINNVVDITNYVMLELGQPLHAFDFRKIYGGELNIRMAKDGERLQTIDGEFCKLTPDSLIIADQKRIIDLAGVMGGRNSMVDSKTKTVFLQAASFVPRHVYRSSKAAGKKTDASIRYSAGIDPNFAAQALKRASELIFKHASGRVESEIDIYPKRPPSCKIILKPQKANALLGVEIPAKEIARILERLSFGASFLKNGDLAVSVPSFRLDIHLKEDLIEEIGRIYGYENIKESRPSGEIYPARTDNHLLLKEEVRDALKAAGFSEIYSYSLGRRETFCAEPESGAKNLIELLNPISKEFEALRPSLLPSLVSAAFGASKFAKEIDYFEIGRAYSWLDGFRDAPELESERAGFVICRRARKENGSRAFFEAKGRADMILEAMGIMDSWYSGAAQSNEHPKCGPLAMMHPFRRAQLKIGSKVMGVVGELRPEIKEKLGFKGECACAEFFLDEFLEEAEKEKEYRPVSKYPSVMRDISVLVPKEVRMTEVEDLIKNAGGPLLAENELFDVYEGEEIGDEKKSFAFRLVFQAEDRTLQDKDIDAIMEKIAKVLNSQTDWEVR